jgi:hypothetical protein
MTTFASVLCAELEAHLVRFAACSELALAALDADDFERLTTVLDERERIRQDIERATATIDQIRLGAQPGARAFEQALGRARTALATHGQRADALQERLLARAAEIRQSISDELAQVNAAGIATGRYAETAMPSSGRLDVTY